MNEAEQLLSESERLLSDVTTDMPLLERARRDFLYLDLESLDHRIGDPDGLVFFARRLVKADRSLYVADKALDAAEALEVQARGHRRLRRELRALRERQLVEAVRALYDHAEAWSRAVQGADWDEALGLCEERLTRSFRAGGDVLPLRRKDYLEHYVRTVYMGCLIKTVDDDRHQRDLNAAERERWIRGWSSAAETRTVQGEGRTSRAPVQDGLPIEMEDEAIQREQEHRRIQASERARRIDAGPCPIHQAGRRRPGKYAIFARAAVHVIDHLPDLEDGVPVRAALRQGLRNADPRRYQARRGASRREHDRVDQSLHRDLPCAAWVLMRTAEQTGLLELATAVRLELLSVVVDVVKHRLYEYEHGRGTSDPVRAGCGWLADLSADLTASLRGGAEEITTLIDLQDSLEKLRSRAERATQEPNACRLVLEVVAEARRLEARRGAAYDVVVLQFCDDYCRELRGLAEVGDRRTHMFRNERSFRANLDTEHLRKIYGRLDRTMRLVHGHGPSPDLHRDLQQRLGDLSECLASAANDSDLDRCYRAKLLSLAGSVIDLVALFADPLTANDDSNDS